MFGLTLAAIDNTQLDRELFYCAALLHDVGLIRPTNGRDFTLAGAEQATKCAETPHLRDRADTIADAICVHATPGVSLDRDGPIGCYLQWGSMVDVVGFRHRDIAPSDLGVILNHNRREEGFKEALGDLITAEAQAVPDGRFAVLVRFGVAWLVCLAPYDS